VFAVIKTGGKQYKVQAGQIIDVEKLDVDEGGEIRIDQVLLAANDGTVSYGRPMIDGAAVTARVVSQHKGPKLVVFKYKSKSRYRRRTGHRQLLTQLSIESIEVPGFETALAPVVEAVPVVATPPLIEEPIWEQPAVADVAEPLGAGDVTVAPANVDVSTAGEAPVDVQTTVPGTPVSAVRFSADSPGSAAPAGDVLSIGGPEAQLNAADHAIDEPEIIAPETSTGAPELPAE